jgi:hypothetical protein
MRLELPDDPGLRMTGNALDILMRRLLPYRGSGFHPELFQILIGNHVPSFKLSMVNLNAIIS